MTSNTLHILYPTVIFVLADLWLTPVDTSRILAVQPTRAKSHWHFMREVLWTLVDNGHRVTVFTPFVEGNRDNYTEVQLENKTPLVDQDAIGLYERFSDPLKMYGVSIQLSRDRCDVLYGNNEMRMIMEKDRGQMDFDLVIVEPIWSDCVSCVAAKWNLPVIYLTPFPLFELMAYTVTGHVDNPSTVSNLFARHAVPKTFTDRFANAVISACREIIGRHKETVFQLIDPREFDSCAPVSPSLIFANGHYITGASRPTLPITVNVGGIHLKPAESLPQDVLEFIERSPHGVIFFALGTTVKLSSLPERVKQAFKKALAQVPQRVLMKYEDEMEDKPKNVMIKKWLPQRDILTHPNIKLFISHGGISGVYETVDAGVPILGLPVMTDQFRNVDSLVNAGMAISMELFTVTEDSILKNILKLINNEKYMQNAKIASKIFKDRPLSPNELVVYWTEYVLRHNGTTHLKSNALGLMWYQYFLLDVIFALIILILIVLYTTYKLYKYIYKHVLKYLHNIKVKYE